MASMGSTTHCEIDARVVPPVGRSDVSEPLYNGSTGTFYSIQ